MESFQLLSLSDKETSLDSRTVSHVYVTFSKRSFKEVWKASRIQQSPGFVLLGPCETNLTKRFSRLLSGLISTHFFVLVVHLLLPQCFMLPILTVAFRSRR